MKTLARSKDPDIKPSYMDINIFPIESDDSYQSTGLWVHYFKNVIL